MFNLKIKINEIVKKIYYNFLWQGLVIFLVKFIASLFLALPVPYRLVDGTILYPPLAVKLLQDSFMIDPFRTINLFVSIATFIQFFIYLSLLFWAIISLINHKKRTLIAFIFMVMATVVSYVVYFNPCGNLASGDITPAVCVPYFSFFTLNPYFYILLIQTFFVLAIFIISAKIKKETEDVYEVNKFLEIILAIISISIIFSFTFSIADYFFS